MKIKKWYGGLLIMALCMMMLLLYSLKGFQPQKQSTEQSSAAYSFFNNHSVNNSIPNTGTNLPVNSSEVKPKIAPTSSAAWGSGTLQWIEFTKLNKITIKGEGVIDGQGSVWCNVSTTHNPTEESGDSTSEYSVKANSGKLPSTKPTALRFYGNGVVTVSGITIQNSQQTHLKFD